MKKSINLLRLLLKYGTYVTVAVNVISYAIEQFENVEPKEETNVSDTVKV